MELNKAESFLTLIHHPEKSRYLLADPHKNVGIIGSILMDLSAENKIIIEDGKLRARSASTRLPEAHMMILRKIYDKSRQKKVKYWISKFSQSPGKYRKGILKELERKGVFRVERENFLFIPYIRAYLIKKTARDQIVNELRDIIFNNREIDEYNAMLLGLMKACKACKVISRNKQEIKRCESRLKEIIDADLISGGVGKVIHEMQVAVVVAIAASAAATTAASH